MGTQQSPLGEHNFFGHLLGKPKVGPGDYFPFNFDRILPKILTLFLGSRPIFPRRVFGSYGLRGDSTLPWVSQWVQHLPFRPLKGAFFSHTRFFRALPEIKGVLPIIIGTRLNSFGPWGGTIGPKANTKRGFPHRAPKLGPVNRGKKICPGSN